MDEYLNRLRDRCQECISYKQVIIGDFIFKDIYNQTYFSIPNQQILDKEIAKVLLYPSTEQAYFRNTQEASFFLQCYTVFQMGNNLELDYLITRSMNVWEYFLTSCAYFISNNFEAFEEYKDEFMLQNGLQKKSYFANDLDTTIINISQYTSQNNIEKYLEVIAQKNILQRNLIQRIPNIYNEQVRGKMDKFYINIYQRIEQIKDPYKAFLYSLITQRPVFNVNFGIIPYKQILLDVKFFKAYLINMANQQNQGITAVMALITLIKNSVNRLSSDFLPLLMVAKTLKNLGQLKESQKIFEILQKEMNSFPNGLYSEYLPYIYLQLAKINFALGNIKNSYALINTLSTSLNNNSKSLYKIRHFQLYFLQLLISIYIGKIDQDALQKCLRIKKEYYLTSWPLLEFDPPQYIEVFNSLIQRPFSFLQEDFIVCLELLDKSTKIGNSTYYKHIYEYVFRQNLWSLQIRNSNKIFIELLQLVILVQLYDYRKIQLVSHIRAHFMLSFLKGNKVLPKDWVSKLSFHYGEYNQNQMAQETDNAIIGSHYESISQYELALQAFYKCKGNQAQFRQAELHRLNGNLDQANQIYHNLLLIPDYKTVSEHRLNINAVNMPSRITFNRNSSQYDHDSMFQSSLVQSVIISEEVVEQNQEEPEVIPPVGIRQDIWKLKTILDDYANPELSQLMDLFIQKTSVLITTSQELNQSILIQQQIGRGGYGVVNQITLNGQKLAYKLTNFNLGTKNLEEELFNLRQRLQEIIILCETLSISYVAQIEHLGFIFGQKSQHDHPLGIYTITQIYQSSDAIIKANDNVKEKFAFQLAQVLNELNFLKITHQDLKPDNLMLDNNGDLVVIDFGISVLNYTSHCVKGPYSYTQRYADPNLVQNGYQSSKNDVYSYGVVLYYFFSCGAKPFSKGQNSDFLDIVSHNQTLLDFPPFIRSIIENATQRQLEKRKTFNQIIYDFLIYELSKYDPSDHVRQFFAMMEKNFSKFYLNPFNLRALLDLTKLQKEFRQKQPLSTIKVKILMKPTNLKSISIDQVPYLVIEEQVEYQANEQCFEDIMKQVRLISNINKLNRANIQGILKLKHVEVLINTLNNTCKFTYLYEKLSFKALQTPQQSTLQILQVLHEITKQNYIFKEIPEQSCWITIAEQVILCNLLYLQETNHVKQNMNESLKKLYITDSLKMEGLQNNKAIAKYLRSFQEGRPDEIIVQLEAGVTLKEIIDANQQQII